MADQTIIRLLVFRVGPLACAAEAEAVREILPRLPTIRIPGAPPLVAGLVNVRGSLITVVEGWRALALPDPGTTDGGTTVLLEVGAARRPQVALGGIGQQGGALCVDDHSVTAG